MAKVKPPTSIWNRPIKLNLVGLFTALGKAAVDVATLNRTEAAKDVVDVIAAFGLQRGVEEQAGLLISRALIRAVEVLIEPYRADFPAVVYPGPIDFQREMDDALGRLQLTLDERFFEQPRELAIVAEFQMLVERWLGHVNLQGRSAKTIAARLPEHFVYGLHRECIDHGDEYSKLFASIRSEFSEAWRRERSWLEYEHWFKSELAGPVFAEDFGLEQIFIWPRAYYVEKVNHQPAGRRLVRTEHAHEEERRHVVELCQMLDSWLDERSRQNPIRVISGEPGAGKSSFARMFAAHRMELGDRVLLIPLHTLNVTADLIEGITMLCHDTPPYPDAPFKKADKAPLLLILDGLDELSKQGHTGSRLAAELAGHVQQAVNTRNRASLRLRVLLCGRPISVQDVESDFRATGQILHLLPYVVSTEVHHGWVDPEGLLGVDQRDAWWRKYGELAGRSYTGLPDELAGKSLVETTCQPLLGYLLALVHRDAMAKGKSFDRDVSRNEIYASLIASVHQRDYNKPGPGHAVLRGISLDEFQELLEEMALAAWHEDTRLVSVAAVERLCEKSGLAKRLREYASAAQAGVGQLFTAFYFRRQGPRAPGEETFEFTHKSFAEYLVARRFVAELAIATEGLAERDAFKRGRGRVKDEQALALDWLEVFGPNAITEDLVPYLDTEVKLRAATDGIQDWQNTLIRLINWVLREGMPCERLNPPLRFVEMMQRAREGEVALLVMLQACSKVTETMSEIDWPDEEACGDWVRRLGRQLPSMHLFLSRVRMEGQTLLGVNLWEADLERANLRGANLQDAILEDANLEGANLISADLWNAILWNARLQGAGLQGANLRDANLRGADLEDANLRDAILEDTNLRDATLRGANLRGADLRGATLRDADLQNADLRGSNITSEQLASSRGTPAHLAHEPLVTVRG